MAQFFPAASAAVQMPDMPTYRGIMEERDAYRVQQNAMAQEQLKQQQNAMLQTIYRRNVDASGNVNQQGIIRDMAQAGIPGIPAQMEALGKAQEATGKGANETFKHAQEILTVSRNELGNARTPQEAMAAGMRIAQQYPEAADGIRQTLSELQGMSAEQFGAWKMDALRKNLTAAQQLQQHYQTQSLGGSTRVLSMPMYGTGAATVVPGSEAQVTMTPAQANPAGKVVQDANGNYFTVDPRTGTAKPVTMGGGGIPGQRGGGGVQTGQYGAAIEEAAKQLAPGLVVSGRGRTPERNAQVGGVANSYHLTDNARDFQPAKGQSLDQLAAALAPLKQQGFDVIIERGKNHVHVEPGAGMARGGAAPAAAGGGQLQGPVKFGKGAGAAATPAPAPANDKQAETRKEFLAILDDVKAEYEALDKAGAIVSSKHGTRYSNILARAGASNIGQIIESFTGTEAQTHRQNIANAAQKMLGMVKDLGGFSAGMFRSKFEIEQFLRSLGNPAQSIESSLHNIDQLRNAYGPNGASPTGDPEMDAIMRKHGGKK
jgi:Peptidase M15